MSKRKINYWLGLFCIVLCSSCETYIYEQEIEIPDAIWSYAEPLDFEFSVEDTSKYYHLYVEVKHSIDYAHQNAYAKLQINYPDGETKKREVSFELADPSGNWTGTCRGKYCYSKLAYHGKKPMKFEQVGNFKMHFEQYTRTDSLKGIHSIRLVLEEAKIEK